MTSELDGSYGPAAQESEALILKTNDTQISIMATGFFFDQSQSLKKKELCFLKKQ